MEFNNFLPSAFKRLTEEDMKAIVQEVLDHPQGLFGLIEREERFNTNVPYPSKSNYEIMRPCSECGTKHEDADAKGQYEKDMREYRDDQARLDQLFKYIALTDCGIFEHPKAEKAYAMAYDRGHSSGYYSILQELQELAELLK